jgi:hypothetical protein
MRKLMVVLSSLLVASSMLFAAGDTKSVEISTTIAPVASIVVNSSKVYSEAEGDIVKAAGLGDSFYVNTKSNNGKGITVSYTMSALKSDDKNNDQLIGTDVYLNDEKNASFVSATAVSGGNIISTNSTTGMDYSSAKITVKPTSASWKTDVKADTYKADISFTIVANS